MPKVVIDQVKATEQFKADLAAMAVGQKPKEGLVQKRQLDKNFGIATLKFNRWSAELDEAQTLDDALTPTFWSGQAEKLMGHDKANPRGRGDIIEIRKLDTGLYAELLVVEIGKGFIKTELVRRAEPEAVTVPDDSPLTTRWNVGKRAHDVIRRSDNEVMARDFQTKAAALEWITKHLTAMAA